MTLFDFHVNTGWGLLSYIILGQMSGNHMFTVVYFVWFLLFHTCFISHVFDLNKRPAFGHTILYLVLQGV